VLSKNATYLRNSISATDVCDDYISHLYQLIYVKKLISLKHCVRSQITRLKLQKSFCDLEHGASL